jgi:hypothetical protein
MPLRARAVSLVLACWVAVVVAAQAADASPAPRPDLTTGAAYLVSPANLIDGHFYETYPRYADFGLTIDGALALAAAGQDLHDLSNIVSFLANRGKDPSGKTVDSWTGIGTASANGGSIAKEALLAEVTGTNPRNFGGHDLIAALDASVCKSASGGTGGRCAGPGNFSYATSVFSQAIGIIVQVRAGQAANAVAPVAFLESLRNNDGAFPSLIPNSHDQDVDSTAMAVMALALVKNARAKTDVGAGLAWIARQQVASGGFRGAGGLSVNSAGLAIQALTLRASLYRGQLTKALAFLAAEQNGNGGFNAYAGGQPGSNVRASTQAVSGATGISFGTLQRPLSRAKGVPPAHAGTPAWIWLIAAAILVIAAGLAVFWARRRRPAPGPSARTPGDRPAT